MIHLHIKGSMAAAFKAADERRIELTSIACRYRHGIAECFASCNEEFFRDVQEWFNDFPDIIEGYGFPAGTLLIFSRDESI